MRQLKIENLKKEIESFKVDEKNSYLNSYQEFIEYFDEVSKIEKHHLIISSHFVYGWMPTILKLKLTNLDEILLILNKAKTDKVLNTEELEKLRFSINNSLVGASKLLHFINPGIYPIWDSKIFKYWSGNKSIYGIQKPENYLEFTNQVNNTIQHTDFTEIHKKINNLLNYNVSPVRALELLIFQSYN
ncbi:hypothetical protein [Christiangramia crocea]|uniref:Uncharacterized protein n=1 Tax=Christiangramia crocea TaxID=2904124 RepID=A0A9X1UYT4_9FLAO|nr:hypothetical protein [Gramella crocea]MCG9972759.1 hypothetical protein [Gramella crocea]